MNLLNEANGSKFVTRKWKIVKDQSFTGAIGNENIHSTTLSDYNEAYILIKVI